MPSLRVMGMVACGTQGALSWGDLNVTGLKGKKRRGKIRKSS